MFARILAVLIISIFLAARCEAVNTAYTTDWIANTYGLNATHVGNAARSMWVDPSGIIYTASIWDENAGGVQVYQNGKTLYTIGAHNAFMGGAITGNATDIFVAMQASKTYGAGYIGRYNRSTTTQDLLFSASADTTDKTIDVITGLATSGTLLYVSDFPGNRVRIFTTDGVWQSDIAVTGPGALAIDGSNNIWVAQKATGMVLEFNSTGTQIGSIQLASGAAPASLYYDTPTKSLMIGDEGPDQNIKIYNISSAPVLTSTFGVTGGYLDTTTGIKGQVGDKRFTRVVGIGKDSAGNLYVLNNPWGGNWDLGRNACTDLHSYSPTGTLQWTLQALNFEAIAEPDPATDASFFYGGDNIYSGTAGGTFVANSIDPFTYPNDPRLAFNGPQRGQQFGMTAVVGANRILVADGQNPDFFYFYHFNTANGYVAVPDTFSIYTRSGLWLASNGDVWAGIWANHVTSIYHYPLTGFDANGKPSWGTPVIYAVPSTIAPLGRVIYLPDTDTLILAQAASSSTWIQLGTRVEVYHGWLAGNRTPNPVISLTSTNPKTITASGNYMFVGYVHTVPNIDAFNLTTGTLDLTMTNSNPHNVYVGNDVDSMYAIRSYKRANGEYVVTKDDYNATSVIVYRWTP